MISQITDTLKLDNSTFVVYVKRKNRNKMKIKKIDIHIYHKFEDTVKRF